MSHQSSSAPRYKTLDIIEFYNQVYEFVSRYLIFVFAGILSIIGVLIVWIWEPTHEVIAPTNLPYTQGFIQETGLIYPIHYFAQQFIKFDGDNKIYGLGGPIWRHQGMWSSIDNIVQYNGIILPRQISRSAWVPKLQQEYYSTTMIKTFLEGMATSQADINLIKSSLKTPTKAVLSRNLLSSFGIGCSSKRLFTTTFCNLKVLDAMNLWDHYDLSEEVADLQTVHSYIFTKSQDPNLITVWCNKLINQYRFSPSAGFAQLTAGCDSTITEEVTTISDMIAVIEEIRSDDFTNTVYQNPVMNWYKLMSWYQYFMGRIVPNEFTEQDNEILVLYDSYITKLVSSTTIVQPYGDIIATFHTDYLLPWLQNRNAFASANQKEVTKNLITTTDLIIQGSQSQNVVSVNSGSRLKPIDFLIAHGLYYDNVITTGTTNTTGSIATQPSTTTTGSTNTPSVTTGQEDSLSLSGLITSVLRTAPVSINKRGTTVIVAYSYKGYKWFASIDTDKRGATQLYYDSPASGATKITHPGVIFTTSSTELIRAIMDDYISKGSLQ